MGDCIGLVYRIEGFFVFKGLGESVSNAFPLPPSTPLPLSPSCAGCQDLMSSMRLCSFLLLASALDFMAKPSQAAPIFAPGNYVVESGFDPEDTGTGPNAPGLLSSVPVQYIESPNLFQSTPLLDLGTTVKPDFKLDLAAIYQDLPFPIPLNTAPEMARWPYNPYCPLEDAYCCTGDYAPETNKFLEGCNPCMFCFLF